MPESRLRAAVFGCGSIGNSHTCALSLMPEVELVGVVDVDEGRAKAFAQKYHAETYYTDPAELLRRDDVDFIVNATANNLHAPLTIQALEAGKHVMVQKPMALNLREADMMIAAAERSGKKLMVSFFEFFHPAFKKAKEIIDRGLIGNVFLMKADMSWYAASTDIWRFDPAVSGGGILMDGHVHHAALFRWFTNGDDVQSVYSEFGALNSAGRCEDTGITLLRTRTRLCELSGSNRLKEPCHQNGRNFREVIEVFGSEGTIHIRPMERPSLRVYTEHSDAPDVAREGWFAPKLEWVPFEERGRSAHFNPDEDPWVGEHRHFVTCIRSNQPVLSDGLFGRKVLEVIRAGYESGKNGRAISLPLTV